MRRCLPQSKTFKISGRFWHAQRLTAYVEPKDAPPEGRPKGRPGIPRPPHGVPRDAHGTPRASLKAAQGRPRRAKQSPKTPYTQCQGCAPPKSKISAERETSISTLSNSLAYRRLYSDVLLACVVSMMHCLRCKMPALMSWHALQTLGLPAVP